MNGTSTKTQFSRFLLVGSVGFLVDAAILQTLFLLGMGPFTSRLVSAAVAMTATWYLSRTIVFGTSGRRAPEYLRHLAAQSVGFGVNLGLYTGVLLLIPKLQETPVIGLIIGSVGALFFNFVIAKSWTYRGDT